MAKPIKALTVLAAVLAAAVIFSFKPEPDIYGAVSESHTETAVLLINEPDGDVQSYTFSLSDATADHELKEFDETEDTLQFGYTEYDFGLFITTINGVEADSDSQYWELSVNGVPSGTGISDLQLTAGDEVSFSLVNF